MLRGVPRREVLWAPGTLETLQGYSKRVRRLMGRALEVAQWGQTDTHAKPMKGSLREVYEIVVEGGPVAVLDVFVKKSTSGISTATHVVERIKNRLARVKEIEREEEVS